MNEPRASRGDAWNTLHKHFSESDASADNWLGVGMVLVALAALIIGLRLLQRYRLRSTQPEGAGDPRRLFRELLRQVPLTSRQQTLLKRIARDLNLRTPAQMLLSPGLFSAAAERWLRLTHMPLEHHVKEFEAISKTLFAPAKPRAE